MSLRSDPSVPVVHARGVVRDRGRFVLGPLDFDIPRGQVRALVGPNGSGKTTLIKSILGIVRPDCGVLQVCGGPAGESKDRVTAVLDSSYLVPEWTVLGAARALAAFYPRWDWPQFESLTAQLGLPAQAKIKELSSGESSKFKLAVALAPQPDFLILDEPTSGLDPLAREQVLQVVADFAAVGARSVLFSTHISEDLSTLSDSIMMLRAGQVVHVGAMADLSRDFVLVQAPIEWFGQGSELVVGLRALGGIGVGVVCKEQTQYLPARIAQTVPTADDVIKAFAVPMSAHRDVLVRSS